MRFLTPIRPGSVRYKDPAFEALLPGLRRGVVLGGPTVLVFTGMPKTFLEAEARQLAQRLGRTLMRLDLGLLVGKYIGETEKNLDRLLHTAEAGGAVLLLDEADALLGRRTDVKDANDRYANLEVSYLLRRLEQFRGLIVITSNSAAEAERSRGRLLQRVVRFPPA